jgi:hypothetical protein
MTCPGSVYLEPDFAQGQSNEYAARGTAMHEASEQCLIQDLDPQDLLGSVVHGFILNQDMIDIISTYVRYVRDQEGLRFYEQKVSLESVIADCYGTADCVIIDGTHMSVIDLKTGAGERVTAASNSQLMCYALGAYIAFSPVFEIETLTLTIVQPPLNSIDSWHVTVKDIEAFAVALQRAYAAIQETPTLYVASEKGCRWCHGKTSCPEMRRLANEAASMDFAAELELSIVEEWMPRLPLIQGFIDAVESKAKEALLAGQTIKGYKVVEGRKSRSWKDESEVLSYLKGQGYDDSMICTKPSLLSVAQLEKALKGEALDLNEFIAIKAGSPTIAKDSDVRKSVDKSQSAKHDFGETR